MTKLVATLSVLALAACFSPRFQEGRPCSAKGECPGDQTCHRDPYDGVEKCYSEDHVPVDIVDAPPPPDAQ